MPQLDQNDDEIYQQLRQAIDDESYDEINRIFGDYPHLDWNHVTPNGLSALWWALTPPQGKNINVDLVNFLLHLNRNQRSIIDPTQSYKGIRPVYYIKRFIAPQYINTNYAERSAHYIKRSYDDNPFGDLLGIIHNAEIRYADQIGIILYQQNELVTDTHNASNPFVTQASDENLKRLYQRYGKQLTVDELINDLEAFINAPNFKKAFPLPSQKDQILKAFQWIKADDTLRVTMTPETGPCSLKDALALIWLAANETDANIVPDINPDDRRRAVLTSLFEIQTAYGHNHPSCWQGKWGRIGNALSYMHQDVYYKDIKLKGELALEKMGSLIGVELAKIYETDPATYWSILLTRLGSKDNEKIARANRWWEITFPSIKKSMIQANVDENEASRILKEMTVDDISLARHEPSRQFELFQKLFYAQEKYDLLAPDLIHFFVEEKNELCHVLESVKGAYFNQFLPVPDDISHLKLNSEAMENIKQRIVNTLLERRNEDEEVKLNDLWNIIRTQMKIDNLKTDNFSNWYKALELPKQLEIANDLTNDSITPSDIVKCALRHACVKGLSLRGMDLRGIDFRGWNLSNIDFRGTDLRKADLRLIQANHTLWKQCNLEDAAFNQYLFPEALIGSVHCTKKLLKKRDNDFKTSLLIAVENRSYAQVKAILKSPHCSEKLLAMPDTNCRNIWDIIIARIRSSRVHSSKDVKILKLIVASKPCTGWVLKRLYNPLFHITQFHSYKNENLESSIDLFIADAILKVRYPADVVVGSQAIASKLKMLVFTAESKSYLLECLKEFLDDPTVTRENILNLFAEMKKKEGDYAHLHRPSSLISVKFNLFFKRNVNPDEKNFWHTASYQKAVKMLKNAYLLRTEKVKDSKINEEKAFIDYYRGNSSMHLLPTTTRRRFISA